jgi:F-type H+-transporting ATPase subunit b
MFTRTAQTLLIPMALFGFCAWAAQPLAAAEPAESSPAHAAQQAVDTASEPGASGEAGISINPVDFRADLAIWTAVVFVVLMAVLWFIAWRPIVEGLHRREHRIADEIASAERSHKEARGLLDQYQKKLDASGGEIQKMLEAARRDAERVGQQIVQKARAEAEADQRRRLEEIEAAATDAIKELGEQSATLAVELAGKIVAAKLDPQDHAQLIEQALTKFSTQEPDAG